MPKASIRQILRTYQTKSTVRSHQSTPTHDRLNLQRTAPLIDTHTLDQTHSTQQSYAHSSIALSHAAPSDPSHAHSLPLTHPIHSLVGTTLSYNIYSLSHSTAHSRTCSLTQSIYAHIHSIHSRRYSPTSLAFMLTHYCRSRARLPLPLRSLAQTLSLSGSVC